MDWVGIGLIVIGIAFFVLVILLIKPLNNLAELFSGLKKTTDLLPQQVADVTSAVKTTLGAGNDTLHQITNQMNELSPLFTIVGNVGETTRKLSSTMLDMTTEMKANTTKGSTFIERNNLEGIYGAITLSYYIFQRSGNTK